MKENKYDDLTFFEQYEKMNRSQKGLEAAGEWYVLKNMLPDFTGKDVLDLGCGFGWHCRYAIENGAKSVVGVDISEKMLENVFSVEHPVFTAFGSQDWVYGEDGKKLYWPVDNYFKEGKRDAMFLGEKVVKYHKTLTSYINTLLKQGFRINEIIEPEPSKKMLEEFSEMEEELRRPMMLLISAEK
ncbi:class I SAM-dependent methyltransferase [Proteiniphilum saccharofermentans]|uniref:class I SAM-dependent methyltransferase n=1 Tax=Proteiniphilum saccharofermentans TaxID=1642647 RepID=UPI0028ACAC61|nr:class I SAM-dependent methyltransferase [Proteiniphilum saccharofermentans]